MGSEPDRGWRRRELVRAGARGAAVAVGAMVAAIAVRRPQTDATRDQACVNRGICTQCPALTGCGLPQALSLRRHADRSASHG